MLRFLVVACLLVVLLAGCGGGSPTAAQTGPTVTLTATPSVFRAGDPVTLTWHSTGADAVVESDFGATAVSDSCTVYPAASRSYLITVSGGGKTDTATCEVTLNTDPYAELVAQPQTIPYGGSAMLYWATQYATIVESSFGTTALSGMQQVAPLTTTAYTLTAKNDDGKSYTARCTVTVQPVEVRIDQVNPEVSIKGTLPFTATVQGAVSDEVTWEVVDPASGAWFTDNVFHAPITPGIYQVRARSVLNTDATATINVTVVAGGADVIID